MNMKRNNSGFSMIEVLVASTIMIMIVMMLGMLFQQSSQAWRTGKQRADTYQQVRAIFGSIQRDASTAVDQNSLPKNLVGPTGKFTDNQSFNGSPLRFYTLTGTGFDNDDPPDSGTPRRSITFVEYSSSGFRSVKTYLPVDGGGYTLGSSQDGSIVTPNLNGAQVKLKDFKPYYDPKLGAAGGANRFPAYVTISAEVDAAGVRSFDVGAASGGPDRTMGGAPDDIRGRDDIKTWAD